MDGSSIGLDRRSFRRVFEGRTTLSQRGFSDYSLSKGRRAYRFCKLSKGYFRVPILIHSSENGHYVSLSWLVVSQKPAYIIIVEIPKPIIVD